MGFEIVPLQRIRENAVNKAFHFHRLNFHQVLFFTQGSGMHYVDFKEIEFVPGCILPVAKGQVQKYGDLDNVDGYALLFTSEFLIKDVDSYKYLHDFVIFNHAIEPLTLQSTEEIENLIEMLRREQENTTAFQQVEYTQNLIKSALICIERIKRSHTDIACEDSLDLYQLFRVKLDKDLSYKLKVTDFCDAFHVSPKRLNAALKLYTGQSAKELIDERLVLESKRLLSYSALSIKEIAYSIGFEDPTNFTQYFKKHAEMLPQDFRKQ